MQHIVAEESGKQRRENGAEGGHDQRLQGSRFCRFPAGAEAVVKHDEDQGDGADIFRKSEIGEIDPQESLGAKDHTKKDKGQKHGDSDLAGKPVA